MIEIVNQQRKIRIEPEAWREVAERALAAVAKATDKNITVAFVSDRRMRELNRRFRGKNQTTDVLSFEYEPDEFDYQNAANNLGEIVISVEQASKQAAENDLMLELEISQLILHGILHLSGYDHETDRGEMNALELKLRDKLGIS